MADYTPGDMALLVQSARNQAVQHLASATDAMERYAVILGQAGQRANALDARNLHQRLIAAQVRLDEIGGDRG